MQTKKKKVPPTARTVLLRVENVERFQDLHMKRIEALEGLQRDSKASNLATIHELERIMGVVNFHAKAVGDNTSKTAQLDTVYLSAAKDLETLKTWKLDIINTWKMLVKDEIAHQIKTPTDSKPSSQEIARLYGLIATFNQKIDALSERVIRIERKFLMPAGKDITADKSVISESITYLENKSDDYQKRIAEIEDFDEKIRQQIKTIIDNITDIRKQQQTSGGITTT